MCVSDIGPLYDKKRNLLTSDKLEMCALLLEQFNSVCTTPLPNKQVTDPESSKKLQLSLYSSQVIEQFLVTIVLFL